MGIDQTIGATPADRQQKNALFVLTKMDREFEQKAGETEEQPPALDSPPGNSLIYTFAASGPSTGTDTPSTTVSGCAIQR